jgi:hypothetical protein
VVSLGQVAIGYERKVEARDQCGDGEVKAKVDASKVDRPVESGSRGDRTLRIGPSSSQ